MRIHFDRRFWVKPHTGKGFFAEKLVAAFRRVGSEVTGNGEDKADVSLQIGKRSAKTKASKVVIRVGPANVDTNMKCGLINKRKGHDVARSHGVIYQSEYSRKIYRKLVYKPTVPETVILNGADPAEYEKLPPYCSIFKYNVVASTRVWLKQKRLKALEDTFFFKADVRDACLYVLGNTLKSNRKPGSQRTWKNKAIYYLGDCDRETIGRLLVLADCMIHTVWVDACPNSVAEALCAGTPVICTDQGGTHELVRATGGGSIVDDAVFPMKPVNFHKTPAFDKLGMAKEIEYYCKNREKIKKPDVRAIHIDEIARQYIEFFKKVCKI